MSLIRVAILEDHSLLSEGFRCILASDPSIVVVGEGDGATVGKLMEGAHPDIILVDGRMPGALYRIVPGGARPWAIVLAAEADEDWAVRVLMAGARGILAKKITVDNLFKAIRVVHEGQIWAGKQVVARVLEELVHLSGTAHAARAVLAERLSAREHEVVRHATIGLSNKEIADRMAISQATIKAHLTSVFQKLGVKSRSHLVALYHHVAPAPAATVHKQPRAISTKPS